jgi:hypothetical protein
MLETQHQLLITLVHGTWGRGFFPRHQHQSRAPFWFEEGSSFLARLRTELIDIPHKITPLLWSGANSIFVRDKAAHALAEHITAEHAEHPEAAQLVIAHSHGGNIALRALHHLKQRDASPSGNEGANPLVVTLATPFVEVHQANLGRRPFYIRLALTLLVMLPLLGALSAVAWDALEQLREAPEDRTKNVLAAMVVGLVVMPLIGWWWIFRRVKVRQNQLDALKKATRLGEVALAERLLVIRAIDDEASLTLALGAILNYVTSRFITYTLVLYFLLLIIIVPAKETRVISWLLSEQSVGFISIAIFPLAMMLFGMLMVSRSVHGRELARSPMECQVNTQSAPDAIGLSKIVTLVRRTYVKSLRHGIYDQEDCAKTISEWVRSELSSACEGRDWRGPPGHEKNSRVSGADHTAV